MFHSDIALKGELVVALDTDIPGFFATAGENYGDHYELLQQYADRLGVKLRILTGLSPEKCAQMLRSGEIDIVAGLNPYRGSETTVIPVCRTSYVMLAAPDVPKGSSPEGKRILISSGFKTSKYYNAMMDSLTTARKFITDIRGSALGRALREGRYDYLICEKNDAPPTGNRRSKIRTVHDFDDQMQVNIILNSSMKGIKEDLCELLAQYTPNDDTKDSEERAVSIPHRNSRGISDYDDIIRTVAQKHGLDWRLLAAIAYHESRFKAHVVSSKGARGLMQIMPVVASHFGIPHDMISDPKTNVMLAARLLKNIENSLQLPTVTPDKDRMSIILACYNAGVGHIADARRLALKYGSNADSWTDISKFLDLKSQAEYYEDEVVRNGIFRGGKQTTAFVDNVLGKYDTYCLIAQK